MSECNPCCVQDRVSGKEAAVAARYSKASKQNEKSLCCAVSYRGEYLDVIPEEIIHVDYGCGDPTAYVNRDDTVLDLGSGSGKTCYILAQVVGAKGRVIGVDCNQDMLALARKHRDTVSQRLGYSNVEFRCGMIQDLALDLERLLEYTSDHRLNTVGDLFELRRMQDLLRHEAPLVRDESVDCVVSNCVLNLVRPQDRGQLFSEIHRVLKHNGRAAISDIVSDRDIPTHLQQDPELWSGCISGAFRCDRFLEAFKAAGFHDVKIAKRVAQPWRTVEGINFHSVTVTANR